MRRIFLTIFICTLVFVSVVPHSLFAATKSVPKYKPVRIFYFSDGKNARASLYAHPEIIDILAPQAYSFDGVGELKGEVNPDVLAFTKKKKMKVMPLVTNRGFNQSWAHAFLDDSSVQDKAIASLVGEAQKNNFYGWQIDFEQMDFSYRDKFSAFIERFAMAMRTNNLVGSVAVIAEVSENPLDYSKNLWQKLIGVYDYTALSKSVDLLSIMSYDDPDSNGPVARYEWLKNVLTYTVSVVPKEKISLGIPLYYWQWDDVTGKLVGIGGNSGVQNVIKKYKYTSGYDYTYEAPYLDWHSKGKHYTLWYENAQSVQKKIDLIKSKKLYGFSAWALGQEVPSTYKVFNKI